ncbi:hypothetical protein CCAX7_35270 [Capsulimonas corticalis]|uniref:Uncharacterized protein n=1 Tax=Capsulimonas corticalis TaxID=2219043 RepID=A0A402CY28_9BACT|nr:hypothetical protein [Capsulimonas corticalis]BDI31476.1 hypothetical protein CCAX7_35270 [Capsulimonas corticalis]
MERITPFPLGQVVATPAAIRAVERVEQTLEEFLERHRSGDWGDICEDDRAANDAAVSAGIRLLSAYVLISGVRLWVITEADRSMTTLLLPEEY